MDGAHEGCFRFPLIAVRSRRWLEKGPSPSPGLRSFAARIVSRASNLRAINIHACRVSSRLSSLFLIFNRYTANVIPLSLSSLSPFSFSSSGRRVSAMPKIATSRMHVRVFASVPSSSSDSHVELCKSFARSDCYRRISRGINRLRRMAVRSLLQ